MTIHVSAMTSAGFRTASLQTADNMTVSFFPLDAVRVIRKTFDLIRPDIIVIAETEIWPNLICEADRRGIPLVLINGRMSEKGFGRYRVFRRSLGHLLKKYDRFFFKTDADATRYRFFNIGSDNTEVTGDMKFDAPLPNRSDEKVRRIRDSACIDKNDFLLVAGSTRTGEEEILADLYTSWRSTHSNFRMIIAPRHIDRVSEIRSLLTHRNIAFSIYDDKSGDTYQIGHKPDSTGGLILVDRLGLLNDLYLAADLAFVGGTLVNVGGHNLLEPVWAGTPVLFGPSLSNVKEAADYIMNHNFGAKVSTIDELATLVEQVYSGKIRFSIKRQADLTNSATARIGDYILSRLDND